MEEEIREQDGPRDQGGTWANDIYHTFKTAKIDYYGNRSRKYYRGPVNKVMYGWCRGSYCARKYWLLLYPGSYGLKVDLENIPIHSIDGPNIFLKYLNLLLNNIFLSSPKLY